MKWKIWADGDAAEGSNEPLRSSPPSPPRARGRREAAVPHAPRRHRGGDPRPHRRDGDATLSDPLSPRQSLWLCFGRLGVARLSTSGGHRATWRILGLWARTLPSKWRGTMQQTLPPPPSIPSRALRGLRPQRHAGPPGARLHCCTIITHHHVSSEPYDRVASRDRWVWCGSPSMSPLGGGPPAASTGWSCTRATGTSSARARVRPPPPPPSGYCGTPLVQPFLGLARTTAMNGVLGVGTTGAPTVWIVHITVPGEGWFAKTQRGGTMAMRRAGAREPNSSWRRRPTTGQTGTGAPSPAAAASSSSSSTRRGPRLPVGG